MARSQNEPAVTLSLVDRLIDEEPDNSREAPLSRSQSVRRHKAALQRDLEWLLNSRRIADEPDDSFEETNSSVYVYGLPDFSSMSMSAPRDKQALQRVLRETLRFFEPRLANVRIIPLESDDKTKRTQRFRIEGMLLMDPAPEHISFDTVMHLSSGNYEIKGAANA